MFGENVEITISGWRTSGLASLKYKNSETIENIRKWRYRRTIQSQKDLIPTDLP